MLDGRFEYRPYDDAIYIWVGLKQIAKFKPSDKFFELLAEANNFAYEVIALKKDKQTESVINDIEEYLNEEKNKH